jgi:uncharacterized protein (DUF952 family)
METIWHLTVSGTPASPGDEGFVHCSFTGQLAGTLEAHFTGADEVTLLRLDPDAIATALGGDALKLEPSRGGQTFPHLYGEVPDAAIVDRIAVARGADGHFNLSAVPS